MQETLRVEWQSIETVKPYGGNPRKRSDLSVQKIAASIAEFGWQQPIVVDKDGVIIVGHGRFDAARSMRLVQVPVVVADHLTPEQVRAYRIADNRTNEETEWDTTLLKIEMADLSGANYNLAMTAFDDEELKYLLKGVEATTGLTEDDDAPAVEEVATTKPGDVWELGNHRLLCGDSTKEPDVARLMNGQKASMVWTDPPYNCKVASRIGTKGVSSQEAHALGFRGIMNDSMPDAEFRAFLHAAFVPMLAFTVEGGALYVAHADSEGYNFRGALIDSGWSVRQCLVWVKNSLVMGRQDYHWKHEPILYGWKPGASHVWLSDRSQTTVLEFDRPARSEEHPTMKPVALVEYCIRNNSKPGQTVLDSFGGSGTTLIACEKLGRYARLLELDPHYCDVIVKRWQAFTGRDAILAGTSETFAVVSKKM